MRRPRDRQAFQFKVSLRGPRPEIWRRIQVPGNYTFWDLHVAIQDAMGWLDYHLHVFTIENPASGLVEEIGLPDPDGELELAGWELRIADYFSAENSTAEYEYDFGDCWVHDLVLEAILPADGQPYPRCIGGERACPPEDCGGIESYQDFLEAIYNPAHDEHDELRTWAGPNFHSERFDPTDVKFDDPQERWRTAFELAD